MCSSDLFIESQMIDDTRFRCVLESWGIVLNSIGTINDHIRSLAALFCIDAADVTITPATPFQWDVTPFDSTFGFGSPYDFITININKVLDVTDLYLYNYKAPNGSRLWTKLAGVTYVLNHL